MEEETLRWAKAAFYREVKRVDSSGATNGDRAMAFCGLSVDEFIALLLVADEAFHSSADYLSTVQASFFLLGAAFGRRHVEEHGTL